MSNTAQMRRPIIMASRNAGHHRTNSNFEIVHHKNIERGIVSPAWEGLVREKETVPHGSQIVLLLAQQFEFYSES